MSNPKVSRSPNMALSCGLLRRASSSLIPLATRSLGSYSTLHLHNRLFDSQFMPFSISSANSSSLETSEISPPVSQHSIADKIENDIASYSNEVVPLPSSFPFEFIAYPGADGISMQRKHLKEQITVRVCDYFQYNGDNPSLPLHVDIIIYGGMKINSEMTAKPDGLDIHEVTMRISDEYMEDFKEYLKSKGITSKTISFLYNRLVFKQKIGNILKS